MIKGWLIFAIVAVVGVLFVLFVVMRAASIADRALEEIRNKKP